MKPLAGRRIILLAVTCSTFLATTHPGQAQTNHEALSTQAKSLKVFLRTLDADTSTRYIAVFRKLHPAQRPDAIVYMIGPQWCGSGGCSTLIVVPTGDSWKVVTEISISRLPIYVLNDVSNGWYSIGVRVEGGGVQPGYEAELRFDGKTYPDNPSIPPARPLRSRPSGELVIASTFGARSLYGDHP